MYQQISCSVYSLYSTRSTLIKFVLPEWCRGAPPVMTTCWPASMCPACRAALSENRIMSSMVSDLGLKRGITPHANEWKSSGDSFGVHASHPCFRQNRESRLADRRDHDGALIAPAPISFAIK